MFVWVSQRRLTLRVTHMSKLTTPSLSHSDSDARLSKRPHGISAPQDGRWAQIQWAVSFDSFIFYWKINLKSYCFLLDSYFIRLRHMLLKGTRKRCSTARCTFRKAFGYTIAVWFHLSEHQGHCWFFHLCYFQRRIQCNNIISLFCCVLYMPLECINIAHVCVFLGNSADHKHHSGI